MRTSLPRLESGISSLDAVLGGGFVQGASYIVQGQPGAGKTILANQVAFAAAGAGKRILYVTLLAEAHDRLFQSLSTLSFFDHRRIGTDIIYLSVFQTLRDEGLPAVVQLLRKETQRYGAELLVFDGLLGARDRAESTLDVKTFVAEVQGQAAFLGCTVLFLTSALADASPEHTMVDGVIALTDEIAGVRSVRRLQVRKSRGSASLNGYHQFEITAQGICVYPRLELALAHPLTKDEVEPMLVPSGVAGLDKLMGGGVRRGSVTLLMGPSGSGKSSFALSFVAPSSVAAKGLLFGFYETPARLKMKAEALGIDLDTLLESGALELLWQPLTENLPDKLAYRLLDAVRERKVQRLVLDGLNGFERAAIYKPRLVAFFAALTNELRALGVTTVATSELRDLFGPAVTAPEVDLSSLSDNLMMLRQVELRSRLHRVLTILKVRDAIFAPALHEVVIGMAGLTVVEALQPVRGAASGMAQSETG